MTAISANSLSGINAAQTALDVSAHNVANQATPGFKRQEVVQATQEGGGVQVSVTQAAPEATNAAQITPPADISTADLAEMLKSKNALLANLSVFRADNLMGGKLLDVKG